MKIRPKLISIFRSLVAIALISLALWFNFTPIDQGSWIAGEQLFTRRLENIRYDEKVAAWTESAKLNKSPIIIVNIDSLYNSEPWDYNKISALITKLRSEGSAIIAYSLIFSKPEKNMVKLIQNELVKNNIDNPSVNTTLNKLLTKFDTNDKLIKQVENKQDIVLSFLLNFSDEKQGILPKPLFNIKKYTEDFPVIGADGYLTNFNKLQSIANSSGFITTIIDPDGIIRSSPLLLRYKDGVYPSLALAVAMNLWPEKKLKLNTINFGEHTYTRSIQLGNNIIKTSGDSQILIPSHIRSSMFKIISATDLLNSNFAPNTFRNKIIFIGSTVSGITAFNPISNNTFIPNIEIQAIVLSCILNNKFLYTPYWGTIASAGIILAMGIIISFLLPSASTGVSIFFALLLIGFVMLTNVILFFHAGVVLPSATAVFLGILLVLNNTIFGYLFENRKKNNLRKSFAKYVPPEYLSLLLERSDEYELEGRALELTVLFADIRNFTTISENLDATEVKKLLNQYFTPMTSTILKYGGTIDKYVGDMIMAFWGAPIANSDHAEAAIDAALSMLAKTEELKALFLSQGLPEINLGIGINSGLMNVGDMGSEFRRAYTVIGDAVNLGSRLQSSTAYYGIKLLIGSGTRVGQTKFLIRLIDKVIFKGKKEMVEIYEVLCQKSEASLQLLDEVKTHEEALDAYFSKNWELASQLFEKLMAEHPSELLYSLFVERIQNFKKNNPPFDWNGAYEFKEK